MSRRPPLAAALAAALAASGGALAGCGETAPSNTTRVAIANPHNERLRALDPPMQRLGLMRAIRDNGNRCRKVMAAAEQGEYRNLARWVALCDDGRHWAIFIAPTGGAQVRNCADARRLDLPACQPLQPEDIPNGRL